MKILDLPLKKEWYEMIESGEKKEEYREVKPYWTKRLFNEDGSYKKFDAIKFRYGYTKRTMMFEHEGTLYARYRGVEKWGARPDTPYHTIKIGKRIA